MFAKTMTTVFQTNGIKGNSTAVVGELEFQLSKAQLMQ